MAETVEIFTDGACSGNPGPGGYGALIRQAGGERELSGYAPHTTNNRMELLAAVRALESLDEGSGVKLTTDSRYMRDGITKWIHGWKKKNWRTAAGKPVKNQDLWKALDAVSSRHKVSWHWVEAHAGHAENERADQLATGGITKGRMGKLPVDPMGKEG